MEKTIEQKVADAILQKDIASIDINGETYNIAPPSIATLILISEIISTLPIVDKGIEKTQRIYSVLQNARHFRKVGDIVAILILGAKGLFETKRVEVTKKYLFGLIKVKKYQDVRVNKMKELSTLILENVRPSVLWDMVIRRLNAHEIGDFFSITTSLSEANILKATREVGK